MMNSISMIPYRLTLALTLLSLIIAASCGSGTSPGGILLQIDGTKGSHEGLGRQVEEFPDIDDDGIPEIIANAPYGLRGNINVYSGGTGAPLYTIESVRNEYLIKNFAVVADLNGDDIPEIASPDTWASRGLWFFSGADGSPLFEAEEEKLAFPNYKEPQIIPVPDKNSDGVPDLVVAHGKELIVISGADGKTIRRIPPSRETEDIIRYCRTADADGDGYDDVLALSKKKVFLEENRFKYQLIGWFISTDDLDDAGEIFDIPLSSFPKLPLCTDLDGDGALDFIGCSYSGGEPQGSVLVAVSSKGGEIWRVNGGEVEGGSQMVTVDAKTGEETNRYTDIHFDDCVAVLPDIDGDDIAEIITGHPTLFNKERKTAGRFFVFSGADGSVLQMIYPPGPKWRIGTSVAPMSDQNYDGIPDILVGGNDYSSKEREKVGSVLVLSL